MISRIEFKLGCRGLALAARFDGQFSRFFDRSATGALRSFWLAILILPFFLLQYWLDVDGTVPNVARFLAGRLVGYAYSWITLPLILLLAARLLDREAEMPGCITIYNWLNLLWVAFQLPVVLLLMIDRDSSAVAVLSYMLLFYSILIEGFVFVRALRIAVWQAAILVAIDVVLNLYVIGPIARIIGGQIFS